MVEYRGGKMLRGRKVSVWHDTQLNGGKIDLSISLGELDKAQVSQEVKPGRCLVKSRARGKGCYVGWWTRLWGLCTKGY